jgi:hypothetical protein
MVLRNDVTLEDFYSILDAIEPDEHTGCHNWPKGLSNGYGRVFVARARSRRAHRLALERKLGRPIKPGYQALHGCDNRRCVSTAPGHVFEDTHARNMQDRAERNPQSFDHLREWTNSPENKEHLRRTVKVRWDKYWAEAPLLGQQSGATNL